MPRKPPKNVVVITGASSALGQAMSLEFAVRGDAIVLSAMSDELLAQPKRACEMLGAWTLGVVVPDRSERAVQELAKSAIERFGRIDIWVNHAAPFERVGDGDDEANGAALAAEMAAFDQGSRAALVVFGAQQHGVLINIDGYANVSGVSEGARNAVRAQFAEICEKAAAVQGVVAHSIHSVLGAGISDLAGRVADLARNSARGGAVGKMTALFAMQQLRLKTSARKVRRRLVRDEAADTVVLMPTSRESRESSGVHDSSRRRGGWHLAQVQDTERKSGMMALLALPLVMAVVMLLLVRS